MNIFFSLHEIDIIALTILSNNPNKVIAFYGDMGVGKTTLIKAIAKALHVVETINSPTFSLINEYKTTDNKKIFHFDLYRLEQEKDAYNIGIEEYLYSNEWCFIEWAEKIPNILPTEHTLIKLKIVNQFYDSSKTLSNPIVEEQRHLLML